MTDWQTQLNNPNPQERIAAIEELRQIQKPETLAVLRDMRRIEKDRDVKRAMTAAINELQSVVAPNPADRAKTDGITTPPRKTREPLPEVGWDKTVNMIAIFGSVSFGCALAIIIVNYLIVPDNNLFLLNANGELSIVALVIFGLVSALIAVVGSFIYHYAVHQFFRHAYGHKDIPLSNVLHYIFRRWAILYVAFTIILILIVSPFSSNLSVDALSWLYAIGLFALFISIPFDIAQATAKVYGVHVWRSVVAMVLVWLVLFFVPLLILGSMGGVQ